MANTLYEKARRLFLSGQIDWPTANVSLLLIDSTKYAPNFADHTTMADVPEVARIGRPGKLTGKVIVGNACDADDLNLEKVTGPAIGAQIIYLDTGDESTSTLIQYMDKGKGYPTVPNGGDIKIIWDDGPYKIFTVPK